MTLLVCFIIANLANLYAIIKYNTSLMEMITSIFYIIVFTLALYVCWSLLRILFYGIKRIFIKDKIRKRL